MKCSLLWLEQCFILHIKAWFDPCSKNELHTFNFWFEGRARSASLSIHGRVGKYDFCEGRRSRCLLRLHILCFRCLKWLLCLYNHICFRRPRLATAKWSPSKRIRRVWKLRLLFHCTPLHAFLQSCQTWVITSRWILKQIDIVSGQNHYL